MRVLSHHFGLGVVLGPQIIPSAVLFYLMEGTVWLSD